MKKVTLLPKWVLPNTLPSVYDTQSGTAIEMVSKVYGAIRELQIEYNSFADKINEKITNFIDSTNQDQECFKKEITKIMHDYIMKIDEKIKMQDLVIDKAVKFMKDNIYSLLESLLKEMKELGEFDSMVLTIFNDLETRVNQLEKTNYEIIFSCENETLTIDKQIKEVV